MKNVKKSSLIAMLLSVPILAVGVFLWTSGTQDANAFPGTAAPCVACHTATFVFPHPAPHSTFGCTQCHVVTGDTPVTARCGVCHMLPGIAQFHATAGVPSCSTVGCHAVPTTETVCNDGIDNDADGSVDCADADCAANPACAPGVEICNDGLDNDNDGAIDCADSNCATFPACVPTETSCTDGTDNDGDGNVDCDDSDCAGNPACAPPSGPPADHTDLVKGVAHKPGKENPTQTSCTTCHGTDLKGGIVGVSCFACHGQVWAQGGRVPVSHTQSERRVKHKPGLNDPFENKCTDCHGATLRGSSIAPSCYRCHGAKWDGRDGRDGHSGYDGRDGHSGYDGRDGRGDYGGGSGGKR